MRAEGFENNVAAHTQATLSRRQHVQQMRMNHNQEIKSFVGKWQRLQCIEPHGQNRIITRPCRGFAKRFYVEIGRYDNVAKLGQQLRMPSAATGYIQRNAWGGIAQPP